MWTNKPLEQHIQAGTPVVYNKKKIVPFSRILKLTLPFLGTFLIWNRPSGVLVVDENGEETLLPVRDETRNMQFLLLFTVGLVTGFLWLYAFRRRFQS